MNKFIITNVSIDTYELDGRCFIDATVTLLRRYDPSEFAIRGSEKHTHIMDGEGNLFAIVNTVVNLYSITYVIRNANKVTSIQIGGEFTLISE